VSGSGISWAICKSATRSRQTTTPAPTTLFFTGWVPFLPPNQQHQSSEGIICVIIHYNIHSIHCVVVIIHLLHNSVQLLLLVFLCCSAAFLTKSVTLDVVVYKYQIWDTAGQEKVDAVHFAAVLSVYRLIWPSLLIGTTCIVYRAWSMQLLGIHLFVCPIWPPHCCGRLGLWAWQTGGIDRFLHGQQSGARKIMDMKLQDLKLTHHIAENEIAGHETARLLLFCM